MAKKKDATVIGEGYEYEKTRVRGTDGKIRHSVSNGDAIAKAMTVLVANAKDLRVELGKVVKANKLGDKFNIDQYDNLGLFRMSLGNSLRGMVRNGTHVVIGDITVKSLEQRVAVPEVKDAPEAKKAKPAKAKAKKAAPRKRKAPAEAPAEEATA